MSVASAFEGLPNTLVSMQHFWRHSLYCALVARRLAKHINGCDSEVVFTAALLHDIGELVIFSRLPEQAKESLLLVLDSADELPVYQAERQIMGFDHAQVGGELARQWKLPPILEECIEFHHDVKDGLHFPKAVALIHIANVIALMAEIKTNDLTDVSPIDPRAWAIIGLGPTEVILTTIQEVEEEIAEAEKLFVSESK
jgi:putative nucleotidyltransferase with HDIG domain